MVRGPAVAANFVGLNAGGTTGGAGAKAKAKAKAKGKSAAKHLVR